MTPPAAVIPAVLSSNLAALLAPVAIVAVSAVMLTIVMLLAGLVVSLVTAGVARTVPGGVGRPARAAVLAREAA
jgi:hypothetical protein